MSNLAVEYWEPVLKQLKADFPEYAARVRDWYPVRRMAIIVKLDDGSRALYDMLDGDFGLRWIRRKEEEYCPKSENEFRKYFSNQLINKMHQAGVTQLGLAELTGVTQNAINLYAKGKRTPSMYNAYKIAKALNCTLDELGYFI